MSKILHLCFLLFTGTVATAQNQVIDSLSTLVKQHVQPDTMRVNLLNKLTYEYQSIGSELDLPTAKEALQLAQTLKYDKGEISAQNKIAYHYYQKADYSQALQAYDSVHLLSAAVKDSNAMAWALTGKGTVFHSQSNYPEAMQYYLQSVQLFEKIGKTTEAASILGNVGVLYKEMDDLPSALQYFQQGLKIHENTGDKSEIARFLNNIGGVYVEQNKLAAAEEAFTKCLSIAEAIDDQHMMALVSRNLTELKGFQGRYAEALRFGFNSLQLYRSLGEQEGIADDYFQLAGIYLKSGKPDSAVYFAKQSLTIAQTIGFNRNIHNTYEILAKAYAATKNFKKAYEAEQLYTSYKDSLIGEDKKNTVAGLKFQYELDKKQTQIELLKKDQALKEQQTRQQRQKIYALITGFILLALFVGVLARNNTRKQKDNLLLRQQKAEIDAQKHRLEVTNDELTRQTEIVVRQRDDLGKALHELKSTQAQLIQKEKMASLGELTAGIAHEIQNPLNFVNNFSEVSAELAEEIVKEADKGNTIDVISLAGSVRQNLEKILYHGKRADAIVKGMLQHSRKSAGAKELTDINALADEYLRRSYHGFRVKDSSFNVKIITDFDPRMDQINIISQDISRVLLNLYNNAFYAVNEKKKSSVKEYEPTVSVSTKKNGNIVSISVKDNGNGIPQNMVDKIFQPFFTTKPTGQGTGLGLSLSYDIIKAHRGEIKVKSVEGEETEFIIQIPVH